jgi:hypothetical protein
VFNKKKIRIVNMDCSMQLTVTAMITKAINLIDTGSLSNEPHVLSNPHNNSLNFMGKEKEVLRC